jgi:L-arabinonolactonase
MTIEIIAETQNILGEGPCWDGEVLRWVDIQAKRVYSLKNREIGFVEFATPVTSIGKRRTGGFIVSTGQGFAFWDGVTNALEFLENPYKADRFNDGKVSPAGAFWAGTMSGGESAAFFRYSSDGTIKQLEQGLTISNGLGWSPDKKVFYLTDTLKDTIYAYDYDISTDEISNRRVFIDTRDVDGKPDGLSVDAAGQLWICMWEGASIRRYDSDAKLLAVIDVPTTCPTSCCFAGENLQQLYITSAKLGDPDNPKAGHVFGILTETPGQHEYLFAG